MLAFVSGHVVWCCQAIWAKLLWKHDISFKPESFPALKLIVVSTL